MMHDFFVKPNTKNKIIEVFFPLTHQATDTESAPGVVKGNGKTGMAYDDSGLKASYVRQGAAADVAITLANMTLGAFTSGGFKEIDGTNLPGWYQFCIPDAALVQGVSDVMIAIEPAVSAGASDSGAAAQIHIHLVRSIAWGGA